MSKEGDKGGDKNAANDAPPPLPLGWTQVKRKKRTRNDDDEENNNANEIDWCCDDPNCMRTAPSVNMDNAPSNATTIKGHAVFCLHEMDPSWFQGYLQIDGQRKPWGLLAIQETIDECLECKDGGYRQITLKVLPYDTKEPHVLKNVEWTGGDMMRLQSSEVKMETHSLWTGKKAVPHVERFFGSLMDKLRDNANDSVLEILPDLAVVTGPITLTLPTPNEESGVEEGKSKS